MILYLFQKDIILHLVKCHFQKNLKWIIDIKLLKKLKNFFNFFYFQLHKNLIDE